MKKVIIIGVLVFIVILATFGRLGGCDVCGTYVNQANPDEYLELKSDRTFFLKELGIGTHGKWEVEDNVLRIHFKIGFSAEGRIKGNKIIDDDGKIWVKTK